MKASFIFLFFFIFSLQAMQQPPLRVSTLKDLTMRKFLEGINAKNLDDFIDKCSQLPEERRDEVVPRQQEQYNLPLFALLNSFQIPLMKIFKLELSSNGNYLFVLGNPFASYKDRLYVFKVTCDGNLEPVAHFEETLPRIDGVRLNFALHPDETFFMKTIKSTIKSCYGIEKIAIPSWEPISGTVLENSPLHALAINETGDSYAYVLFNGRIKVRRMQDDTVLHELDPLLSFLQMAQLSFGNGGTQSLLGVVLQAGEEIMLHIWHLPDEVSLLGTDCTRSNEIQFFDKHMIISSLSDGPICYEFVSESLQLLEGYLEGITGCVHDMGKDGLLLIALPGQLKIMHKDNLKRCQEISLTTITGAPPHAVFTPDGGHLIMADSERQVALFSKIKRNLKQAAFETAFDWYIKNNKESSQDTQQFFLEHKILKTFEDHRRKEIETMIRTLTGE